MTQASLQAEEVSTAAPSIGTPQPPRAKSGYIPTLDGWRSIAILLVLLCHGVYSIDRAWGPSFDGLVHYFDSRMERGQFGVQLFFAISGFLITARLLEEQRTRGSISLRQFYIRRAFRILPAELAYLFVVAILALSPAIILLDRPDWLSAILCYSNYVRPNSWFVGHFWSLNVEEHFYFLWPSILVLVGLRRGGWWAAGLAIAVALWRAANVWAGGHGPPLSLYAPHIDAAFAARTDLQADSLLWGCAFAFVYTSPSWRPKLTRFLSPAVWTVILITIFAVVFENPRTEWKSRQTLLALVRFITPLLIIGTIVRPTGLIGKVLESPALRWIGRLSYSLYLWQQLFLSPGGGWLTLGPLQSWPWNLLAIFACAALSYAFVEKPLIKIGHAMAKPASAGRGDLKN